jgi:6-phosphogluconolactonase (cycloisomerase 2 family)
MKFRKFGKTVLTAALGSAIVFSLSSCVYSFTSGYLYVTGTVTATPSGNGIISGFKIDNNTGKLNVMHGLPVSSGGANPVRAVLLTGGRFVYVLNRGTNAEGGSTCTVTDPCSNANIQQFVVGGNGILTPQETFYTQGLNPFRLVSDTSGNFLLALDHDAPSNAYCGVVITGATSCGDITVFSVNSNTGRLSLVTNAQLTTATGSQVSYFPVPADPIDFSFATGNVFTLAGAPSASPSAVATTAQTVFPYGYNSSNGQLSSTGQGTPQVITNGAGNPMGQGTAIVYAGGRVYVLDNEPITVAVNGVTTTSPSQILPYTVGSNGALQSATGGAVPDDPNESNPIYLIVESKGKFLYLANQQGANSSTGAGITAYVIAGGTTSSQLSENPGSPYGTGANPQCLVEDPSNQYIYTANASDSTITGKLLDPNSGSLRQMSGSTGTFPLTGPASWCFVTGRTN